MVEGENLLNRDVDVEFQFTLLKDGDVLENTDGFYLAYSTDIDYAYSTEYGQASDWEGAKAWMDTHLDWFDWVLSANLANYNASVITDHNGNSTSTGLPFNYVLSEDLSPGRFYAIIYLDVDEAVTPGDYTFSVDMMPAAPAIE